MYLSLDKSLVGGDKIVWPSSFLTYCHDGGGRGYRSAILHSDYYCDMVGASRPRSSLGSSEDRLRAHSWMVCMHNVQLGRINMARLMARRGSLDSLTAAWTSLCSRSHDDCHYSFSTSRRACMYLPCMIL